MKTQGFMLAIISLMLSAGPLMAMDSEFQDKRRQALHAETTSSVQQGEGSLERRRERHVNQRGDEQHSQVDSEWEQWELTQEALRYWWR
ncbi:hypothetical protein [Halomonas lysinitropha]|uniref:Uncharacterized protein n=1 Tax=Halomonas lysinitropha TaxID=2607506 RepID=A0A5K1I1B0_9GAMM|nr:hypothetical protein [Halomonas lysinitropha]VVZ95196.1 hypothetical protein HALO32_01261 [Halomonas lysinitropha]